MESSSSPSQIYCTSAKQKAASRDSAKLVRYGLPKLRNLLREKYLMRMKEARHANHNLYRPLDECLAEKHEILRKEIIEFEKDIELQEVLYNELMGEVNDWFIEQQEEENYIVSTEENNDIICPICKKQFLECSMEIYKCNCGIHFSYTDNVDMLQLELRKNIDFHEVKCANPLTFFIEAKANGIELNQLNVVCEKCDYLNSF